MLIQTQNFPLHTSCCLLALACLCFSLDMSSLKFGANQVLAIDNSNLLHVVNSRKYPKRFQFPQHTYEFLSISAIAFISNVMMGKMCGFTLQSKRDLVENMLTSFTVITFVCLVLT